HADNHDAHDHHADDADHHDASHHLDRQRRGADAVNVQTIANRYELGERLGLGGMSTVNLAFDRRLEREVAVKLLAEHLADDPSFVARFKREALAAARLVHPNIVQVFDFGFDDPSGRHYIVMEYIRGQSGAEILRDQGQVPLEEALAIIGHSCRGLDYAHRNGVIHRDVKPGNLLRSDDGLVKLADFGIAKALSEESAITQVGSVLGTAAYLAPEQAHGEEADARSDLYSLGVVTYQLLSGKLPYEANSLTELALMQQREAPPLLHELVPDVPPQLSAAVDKALNLNPADRYATAEEMRAALVDGARGVGPDPTDATHVVSRTPTSATRAVSPATAQHDAPPRRLEPREPRRGPIRTQAEPEPPARRRRGGGRRLLTWLVVLALLGGGAAVAVDKLQTTPKVQIRDATGASASETIAKMQQLIDDNTR
ncbi:MAG: eukaryotic-like serine/threonine-protein kinase, partial [Solirubrobacteraceae bacterium]|nr:eukaryotic-like serine/threonine-protein kinase [Solirubrobacteraceae bacterium]